MSKVAVFSGKWWQKRLVSIHHRVIDVRSLDSSQRNMPMTHPSNSRAQWGEILYKLESFLFFENRFLRRPHKFCAISFFNFDVKTEAFPEYINFTHLYLHEISMYFVPRLFLTLKKYFVKTQVMKMILIHK